MPHQAISDAARGQSQSRRVGLVGHARPAPQRARQLLLSAGRLQWFLALYPQRDGYRYLVLRAPGPKPALLLQSWLPHAGRSLLRRRHARQPPRLARRTRQNAQRSGDHVDDLAEQVQTAGRFRKARLPMSALNSYSPVPVLMSVPRSVALARSVHSAPVGIPATAQRLKWRRDRDSNPG